MSGGPKGHALFRHGGVGAIDIVGGDEAGDVDQHPWLGGFTGMGRNAHYLPPVTISAAIKSKVFPAARRHRESRG